MPTKRKPKPPVDPDEAAFIEDILDAWEAAETSKDVARFNIKDLARFLAARNTRLAEATQADCREWLKQRHTEVAPVTVARCWSDARSFYTVCVEDHTNPLRDRRSPMDGIKMPRHPKFSAYTHAASVAEVDAVIRTFDLATEIGLRNATMVSLMFNSGPRVSEVANLMMCDLDLAAGVVTLPYPKNGKPRHPRIHPETMTLLKRYLRRRNADRDDESGPVFINRGGRARTEHLPVDAVKTIVKRAAAKAGAPVTPHTLRRGFAVEYIDHGGDIPTLMILGGWTEQTMILRYLGDKATSTAHKKFDLVAQRQVDARRRLRRVV